MKKTEKVYDERYFNTWYRQKNIGSAQRLQRKVALAVAVAEYQLERPVRTVLDIGCGEGVWYPALKKIRPAISYLGFDSSEYAVSRYGRTRHVHYARFSDFDSLRPCPPVDLLVCSDVMHYLPTRELKKGLPGLAELTAGVAFLEVFTREDDVIGDRDEFFDRSAAAYRNLFESVGFAQVGSHCWLSPARRKHISALEICT